MRQRITIYDTTLRDGTQGEGVSFSMEDKVRLASRLDALGIHYIEGGWPGSNPKDLRFFRRMQDVTLKHAKLAAFSIDRTSTRLNSSHLVISYAVFCLKKKTREALLRSTTPSVFRPSAARRSML